MATQQKDRFCHDCGKPSTFNVSTGEGRFIGERVDGYMQCIKCLQEEQRREQNDSN